MAQLSTLNDSQITSLCQQFGIDNVVKASPIIGGVTNTNYKIDTNEKSYILRIWNTEDPLPTAKMVYDLTAHLNKHGIASPACLPYDGSVLHENSPVMMIEFIDGYHPKPEESLWLQLAKTLRQLHSIPVPDYLPKTYPVSSDLLKQISPQVPDKNLQKDLLWASERFEEYAKSTKRAIVHGDIFLDNIMLDSDDCLWILDFEVASAVDPVIDIAVAIIGCCDLTPANASQRIKLFCKTYGYQDHMQVTEAIAVLSLAWSAWRFRQFELKRTNDSRLGTYHDMWNRARFIKTLL